MRALAITLLAALTLTGCGGEEPISDEAARAVCKEWLKESRPGWKVTVRDPVVAEKDRMATVGAEAAKDGETEALMCAVDLVKGEVIAGFS